MKLTCEIVEGGEHVLFSTCDPQEAADTVDFLRLISAVEDGTKVRLPWAAGNTAGTVTVGIVDRVDLTWEF